MTKPVKHSVSVAHERGSNLLISAVMFTGFVVIIMYFGMPILRRWEPDQFSIPVLQVFISDKTGVNATKGGE